MANSFSQVPPGTYLSSYSAAVPPIARRSSYAAVVSGTATASGPARRQGAWSGVFSQVVNPSSTHGLTATQSSQHTYSGPSESSHLSNDRLPQVFADSETGHMQPNPSAVGPMEGAGGSMPDFRSHEFFVPSYLRGTTYIERLEDKYKARLSAQRDGRSGRSSVGGSLSTSASSMSLPKMIPSHRGMTYDIQEKHITHVDDGASFLPSRWSTMDKFSGLEVIGDGMEIRYNGVSKTPDEAAAIRADHPIPKQCGIYYFEVTIMSKSKEWYVRPHGTKYDYTEHAPASLA